MADYPVIPARIQDDTTLPRTGQRNMQAQAIHDAQIANLTFDKATGGTLILGGSDNGNGSLQIKDSSNTIIVQGDNSGLTIFSGSLTIKDSTNTTIIDSTGLVSQNNFRNNTVTSATSQNTTSTSYTDLDSMTLTTASLSRSVNALILFTAQASVNTTGGAGDWYVEFIVNIDGIDDTTMFIAQGGSRDVGGDQVGTGYQTPTMHRITSLTSGSHTIKIRWKIVNNSGTGQGSTIRRTLSYVLLGS